MPHLTMIKGHRIEGLMEMDPGKIYIPMQTLPCELHMEQSMSYYREMRSPIIIFPRLKELWKNKNRVIMNLLFQKAYRSLQ